MLVITSSTHTSEEVSSEAEMRLACERAELAEKKAQAKFDANPTTKNFVACRDASRVVIDSTNALCDHLLKATR